MSPAAGFRWSLLSLLLLAETALLGCSNEPAAQPASVGLSIIKASDFDLADYQGRVTVLNIWGTWCPPCRDEVPALIKLRDELPAEQVAIVGIAIPAWGVSTESKMRRKVAAFAELYGINYDLVLDPEFDVARELDRHWRMGGGVPATFVLDQDGDLVSRYIGLPLNTRRRPDPYGVLSGDIRPLLR